MTDAVLERSRDSEAASPVVQVRLAHLPILDSVRGVAILSVILFHATLFTLDTQNHVRALDRAYLDAASVGWCGVDLFFALSGFLITRILLHTKHRPNYLRNFYARRTLRIFPLYYCAVIAYLVSAAVFQPEYARRTAPWLLTYTSNIVFVFDKTFVMPLMVGHFWSLALEEQFYLLWPFLVLVLSRRNLGRVCIGWFVVGLCTRIALVHADNTFAAYRFTLCRFDTLALGGGVALLTTGPNPDLPLYRKWASFVLPASVAALLGIALLRGNFAPEDPVVTSVGISFLALFMSSLLLLVVTRASGGDATGPGHAFLSTFGRYSYGMYVLHQPIATVFIRLMGKHRMPLVFGLQLPVQLLFLAAFLALTFGVAVLSYHGLEKRFLRLKAGFQ